MLIWLFVGAAGVVILVLAWVWLTRLDETGASSAPPRRRKRRTGTGLDGLLEHIDSQIDLLLTERHRLQMLTMKGQRLRGMMQQSAQHRSRVPTVDRVLRLLSNQGAQLDSLIGRYHRHRDDVYILRAADEFNQDLEAYEATSSVSDPYGSFRIQTEELDEETERLLAVADAEQELDEMLRA